MSFVTSQRVKTNDFIIELREVPFVEIIDICVYQPRMSVVWGGSMSDQQDLVKDCQCVHLPNVRFVLYMIILLIPNVWCSMLLSHYLQTNTQV